MLTRGIIIVWLVVALIFLIAKHVGNATPPAPVSFDNGNQLLKPAGVIDLPGPKGKRFDYLTIDYGRNLFFPPTWAQGFSTPSIFARTSWSRRSRICRGLRA
jgi:hypothetical protein